MNVNHAWRWLLVLLTLVPCTFARAGTVGPSVVALFPKDTAEFAYADLEHARQFPWFAQFKLQTLPKSMVEFERLLQSSGVDASSQISSVVWALGPARSPAVQVQSTIPAADQLVAVAQGHFDPESAQAAFQARKFASTETGGLTVFSCGANCDGLYFTFLDSNTLAFGKREPLLRMLDVRNGLEENLLQNESFYPLIQSADDGGLFWGVFHGAGARLAVTQLLPGATEFSGSAKLLGKVKALIVTVDAATDLSVSLRVVAKTPEDALVLSQLLAASLLLREYQVKQSSPEFAEVLDSIQVASAGNDLNVSLSLKNEQMLQLIQRNSFVPSL